MAKRTSADAGADGGAGDAQGRASAADGSGASTDDARYARLRDLLDLLLRLQGALRGYSREDVAAHYGVSSRTAARMLRTLREAVPAAAVQTETDAERMKRWRLRPQIAPALVQWTAPELAAIDSAAKAAERDGRPEEARSLEDALAKIRACMRPSAARRVEPDLEALTEAQGFAMRAGPHPEIDGALVAALREAILAGRCVRLEHRSAEPGHEGELRRHTVGPLGFLFGHRPYLVAWSEARGMPLLFRLSRIERAARLDTLFAPPEGFDLRRYAERSFGVFQEEPVDVVWRFRPAVADEAREWRFHPQQETETQPDGGLLVRFRAGGLREMAWHLFSWGPDVEILSPPALRDRLAALLSEALAAHRPRTRRAEADEREPAERQGG